jgi:hypothetical protein
VSEHDGWNHQRECDAEEPEDNSNSGVETYLPPKYAAAFMFFEPAGKEMENIRAGALVRAAYCDPASQEPRLRTLRDWRLEGIFSRATWFGYVNADVAFTVCREKLLDDAFWSRTIERQYAFHRSRKVERTFERKLLGSDVERGERAEVAK